MAQFKLNQIDKLEILTLEDNYLDLVSGDNSGLGLGGRTRRG